VLARAHGVAREEGTKLSPHERGIQIGPSRLGLASARVGEKILIRKSPQEGKMRYLLDLFALEKERDVGFLLSRAVGDVNQIPTPR